ncbi:unnamed protein product [Kuraishia capsulata CBS 1993]|uniref:5'-3' DNA helicase ZGRF1-like N-terminal domain-containing protein n=1 Tax=Kuraishia capsulata CBS 1993 TaxID=1382522 RepID=W6MIE6_9ASCO|nr:uncharacterized protein KUCA_T00001633001 [Kuraishia capsulata CBS 1993]CDK25663.1 unnamed protein product [Kuraishia capsulata CBS 1993]
MPLDGENNPLEHSRFSEYIILYTTDVVKKLKKWHDGKLRFFEFNRKIIVYSENGHVVNTDFSKKFQLYNEGDEIALAGMTVQIVESTGDYERDISTLYNTKVANGKPTDEQTIPAKKIKYMNEPSIATMKSERSPLSTIYPPSQLHSTPRRMVGLTRIRHQSTPTPTPTPTSGQQSTEKIRTLQSVEPNKGAVKAALKPPARIHTPQLLTPSTMKTTRVAPEKSREAVKKLCLISPSTSKVKLRKKAGLTPRIRRNTPEIIEVPPPPPPMDKELGSPESSKSECAAIPDSAIEQTPNNASESFSRHVEVCASDTSEEVSDFDEDSNPKETTTVHSKTGIRETQTVTYDFGLGEEDAGFTLSDRFRI